MSPLNFSMRLTASYRGDTNEVQAIEVEHIVDATWRPLELDLASPGFDIFIYAILTCQHLYLRMNCAERGLLLDSATGELHIGASDDRRIESLSVSFSGRLRQGEPNVGDIDYIERRMQQCPVSINLAPVKDIRTRVQLEVNR